MTSSLLFAAVSGLLLGSQSPAPVDATADAHALDATDPNKHACKGQNVCKGHGGCKTDKHACKGQNACKGQGGCRTDGQGSGKDDKGGKHACSGKGGCGSK